MGLKSAGFFCNTNLGKRMDISYILESIYDIYKNLGLCFSKQSFEDFMLAQESQEVQELSYYKSFSRYLE